MAKKLNILHLSTAKIWRGAERQIVNLYKGLQPYCDQYIVCPTNSPLAKYCQRKNITHHTIKMGGAIQPKAAYFLYKFVNSNPIDIIHTHDSHAINLYLIAYYLGIKIPAVASRRVDFEIGKGYFSLWKYNHSGIKKIICVSHAIQNIISSKIKDKQRILTVYSGIDIQKIIDKPVYNLYNEFKIPKERKIVGTAAALVPHKDIDTFIDTANLLQKENIQFVIFGKGEQELYLKNKVQRLGIKNILFAGHREDIIQCIKGLDIFLFTSKMEGLSTTVLDTMACRIPIVGTLAGGAAELLIPNTTALTASIGNAQELAQNIQLLLQDSALRNHITENAFNFVQNFDYTYTATQTLEVYKNI
jgi:glycosyltransferase involved in cell wall biosynthesis